MLTSTCTHTRARARVWRLVSLRNRRAGKGGKLEAEGEELNEIAFVCCEYVWKRHWLRSAEKTDLLMLGDSLIWLVLAFNSSFNPRVGTNRIKESLTDSFSLLNAAIRSAFSAFQIAEIILSLFFSLSQYRYDVTIVWRSNGVSLLREGGKRRRDDWITQLWIDVPPARNNLLHLMLSSRFSSLVTFNFSREPFYCLIILIDQR